MFREPRLRHARAHGEARVVVMTVVSAVFVVVGWGALVWLVATVARRVIGTPVGWPRTVLLSAVLQRLPGRIDQISADLAAGRLAVAVRVFEHPADRAFVSELAQRLITAVFAAACVVAAAVLLVAGGNTELTGGVAVSAILAAALGLIGAVLGIRVLLRT